MTTNESTTAPRRLGSDESDTEQPGQARATLTAAIHSLSLSLVFPPCRGLPATARRLPGPGSLPCPLLVQCTLRLSVSPSLLFVLSTGDGPADRRSRQQLDESNCQTQLAALLCLLCCRDASTRCVPVPVRVRHCACGPRPRRRSRGAEHNRRVGPRQSAAVLQ